MAQTHGGCQHNRIRVQAAREPNGSDLGHERKKQFHRQSVLHVHEHGKNDWRAIRERSRRFEIGFRSRGKKVTLGFPSNHSWSHPKSMATNLRKFPKWWNIFSATKAVKWSRR